MNSLEIQYFLTIVKHGSFTEAAQVLSVSQPAISKQIRQLEEELGCSLFTRSGRTLSLTPAGQAYHDYFQQCHFQLALLKKEPLTRLNRIPLTPYSFHCFNKSIGVSLLITTTALAHSPNCRSAEIVQLLSVP